MSTASVLPAPPFPQPRDSNPVVVQESVLIPGWINSLETYREWARSDDYPQTGWISYLDGKIWVDTEMEEFLTHNQVKLAYTGTLFILLQGHPLGKLVPDRMLLSNLAANLSTEPDLLFFFWTTMQTGRIRLVPGKKEGYMELEGTPDMVLEIVSKYSERKDTEILRELYWKAGITEYWLVDVRGEQHRFEILRYGPNGYTSTPAEEGWLRSDVFGHSFQLVRQTDPLGHPLFVVNVK